MNNYILKITRDMNTISLFLLLYIFLLLYLYFHFDNDYYYLLLAVISILQLAQINHFLKKAVKRERLRLIKTLFE